MVVYGERYDLGLDEVEKFGLDTQLRECPAYAASHDLEIIAELSDDISGIIPIDERSQGKLIPRAGNPYC
jgi:hypothetical protein